MVSTDVSAEVSRPRQPARRGTNAAAPGPAQLAATVRGLGVDAEDLPGFFAAFVLMLVVVDATVVSSRQGLTPLRQSLQPGLGVLAEIVVSYVLALVLYRLAEFWDELWDRCYSVRYKPDSGDIKWRGWLLGMDGRVAPSLWLLPGGRDLDDQRRKAQNRLGLQRQVYRAALTAVRRSDRSAVINAIEASRARSRLCRTLILPVLVVSIVCLLAPDADLNLAGFAGLVVVLGLLVAYANERVSHVDQLYTAVGDL
jgi:hypothetical protein